MHHCANFKRVALMKTKSRITRLYLSHLFLLVAFLISSGQLAAQDPVSVEEDENSIVTQDPVPVDENGNPLVVIPEEAEAEATESSPIEAELATFSSDELEEFVGPIALYPDNLLAIILPASTYPLQIVLAARFLEALENDSSLEPDETWDESVIALLNYPEVIQMMNENIQWTWQLGEAVVTQETDVLTAIGVFREKAVAAGNLESDEYQTVTNSDEVIEITQVEETVVYVPYYVPEEVIVYQPEPVYHYYPTAYPVYYYPYPAGYRFRSGFFWGLTTAFGIGWHDHHLRVWHHSYSHHPYYGRYYDSRHRYRRPDIRVFNRYYVDNSYRRGRDRHRDGSYWRPQRNSGARPFNRRNRYNDYPARSVPSAFNANRRNVAVGDYGGNAANRGNGANREIAANRGPAGTRPNRGNGGRNNNRRTARDLSAGNGITESNVATANSGLRSASNDRQGNREPGNNRGTRSRRSDTSAIVGNNSGTTAGNALTASNNRPRDRRQNNDRRSRIDRESGQSDVNALSRSSNPANSTQPERGNRVQPPRSTNRSADDGRRRRDRIERQLRDLSSTNTVVPRSTRQATTNSSPARQQSITPGRSQDARTLSRANAVSNQVNRSRGATISEPRNRQARQAPRRQSSVTTPRAQNSAPASRRQSSASPPRRQSSAPPPRRQSSAPPPRRAEQSRRSEPSRRSQSAPNRRSSAPAASRRAPSSPRQSGSGNRRGDRGRPVR